MNEKDYYKILSVNENAVQSEIKKSYRNLAFRYHPDKNPGGEEMMKEINEAYAVLSDPVKKREYDSLRQTFGPSARDRFRRTYTDQDIFRGSDIGQVFEELSKAFGFSRPEDIFSRNNFYGQSYQTFQFKRPGFSGGGFVFYGPLRNVLREQLKMPSQQTGLATGQGNGLLSLLLAKAMDYFRKAAARKLGLNIPEKGKDLHDGVRIAGKDASAGGKVQYLYTKRGKPRDLLITVPPGIRDGQKIKLKGLGLEGKQGGEPGDLYLKVSIYTPFVEKVKGLFGKK